MARDVVAVSRFKIKGQVLSTTSVGIPKIDEGIILSGGIAAIGSFLATVILKARRFVAVPATSFGATSTLRTFGIARS